MIAARTMILEMSLPAPKRCGLEIVATTWLYAHALHQTLPETAVGSIHNPQLSMPEMAEFMGDNILKKCRKIVFQQNPIQTYLIHRPDCLASSPATQIIGHQRFTNAVKVTEQVYPVPD